MFNSLFKMNKPEPVDHLTQTLTFEDNKQVKVITRMHYDYNVFITYNIKRESQYTWGNTPEESLEKFKQLYTVHISKLKKRGRNKKHHVVLYCRLPANLKIYINDYCEAKNINSSQFIEQLIQIQKSQQA